MVSASASAIADAFLPLRREGLVAQQFDDHSLRGAERRARRDERVRILREMRAKARLDPAGPGRHDEHVGCEEERFLDAVRDPQNSLAAALPDALQLLLQQLPRLLVEG